MKESFMQDTNWKTWGLALLVVLSVVFEMFKHIPSFSGGSGLAWENGSGRIGSPNRPYSIKEMQGRDRPTLKPSRVSALTGGVSREQLQKFIASNTPNATTFDHEKGAEGKKADAKKEECDEKAEPKIDPKTGKPIACKKKKKKKEEAVADNSDSKPQSNDDRKKEIDTAAVQAAGSGVMPQPLPDPNQPDMAFDSQQNWEHRLLNVPDLAETKIFIDHYQRNLVTAQVFYTIVNEMITDKREEMRSLGVMCAALTPSATSFELLADLTKTERPDSSAGQAAAVALNQYTDLSRLSILANVLSSPTVTYATLVAAQKVERAVVNVKTSNPNSAQTSSTLTAAQLASQKKVYAQNLTALARFVPIFQNLEHSSNATVAAQSLATLGELQSLLGTTPPSQTQAQTEAPATDPNLD
jgi:hypothetical protein